MPKLLPQVRERLIEAARDTLKREGYGGMSVRELATACGIAVGTFYHYFSTKNDLVAAVMLEDWLHVLSLMDEALQAARSLTEGMARFFDALAVFVETYAPSWAQYSQKSDAISVIHAYHHQLRAQLSTRVGALLDATRHNVLVPLKDLLAETLLTSVIQPDIGRDAFLALLRALQ